MKTLHPFNHRTAFWFSVVTSVILTVIMLLGNLYNKEQGVTQNFHLLLTFGLNIFLFYVLFIFNFQMMKKPWSLTKRYIITITGTILITIAYTLLSKYFRVWVYSNDVVIKKTVNINIIKDGVVAAIVLLTTFLLFQITRRQQIVFENQQLASENMRIRYDALETQLDPHFLFNSLNTLNGLIGIDDDKAHEYVQQLASTYRYIIQNKKLVRLREELAFTDSYIYLMQIRYGKNLNIESNVPDIDQDKFIVPISLQLLIENAIKHNVISDKYPLKITIEVNDHQSIKVTNHIHLKAEEPLGGGLGLVNLTERYQLLFHKEVIINQDQSTFRVEIPLIEPEKAEELVLNLQ